MNDRQNTNDEGGAVFQPDTLLASQYFDRVRRHADVDPVRRLMLAILEDAVTVVLKNAGTNDPGRQALLLEAEEWIADRDPTWLYSFENICAVLELEPDYLRRGLRARKERAVQGDGTSVPAAPESGLRRASG